MTWPRRILQQCVGLALIVLTGIAVHPGEAELLPPVGSWTLESHTSTGDFRVMFRLSSITDTILHFLVSGDGARPSHEAFLWQLVILPDPVGTVVDAVLSESQNLDSNHLTMNVQLPFAADIAFAQQDLTLPWSFNWDITFTELPMQLMLAFEAFEVPGANSGAAQYGAAAVIAALRPVPEPATWLLLSTGCLALVLRLYRRQGRDALRTGIHS